MSTVLVIDDEEIIAQSFGRIVESDHDIVIAETASAAMNLIYAGGRFDLIVYDLDMPGMDGMAFHSWLRDVAPDQIARVVFATVGALASDSTALLEEAGHESIEKPFDPAAVRALAQRFST